jgi:DNA-binding transcriptional LysR family regulator
MLDWNDLRTFAEVARRGSLSAAARAMNVHQTTIARRLAAAEAALGAALFLRTTRGVTLAPAGTRLLGSLHPLVDEIDSIARKASAQIGPVRVAVTDNGARILAAHALSRWRRDTTPIELELLPGNAPVDLARGEADLAIRVIAPAEANLVRQRLGEVQYALYASRAYLDHAPSWRDGGAAQWILVPSGELGSGPEATWLAEHAREAQVALRASNHITIATACEHGAGACVLPTNLASFHAGLVRVRKLPEIPGRAVWLVMHRDARKEPHIRQVAARVATAMRDSLQRAA